MELRSEVRKSRREREYKPAWDISVKFINLCMSWVKDLYILVMEDEEGIEFYARVDVCETEAGS